MRVDAHVPPGARVDLPTYRFQRERAWLDPVPASRPEDLGLAGRAHPLLPAANEPQLRLQA